MKRDSMLSIVTATIAICIALVGGPVPTHAEEAVDSANESKEFQRGQYYKSPELLELAVDDAPEKDDEPWKASIGRDLLPGPAARTWRSTTFGFSWLDQANCIPTGLDPEGQLVCEPNADSVLRKLDFTVSPGRWFRSAADFSAAYGIATAKATKALVDPESDPLKDLLAGREPLEYLAWIGPGGTSKRFLSGLQLKIGYSERAQGIRPELPGDETAFTGTLSFDPDAMVTFPGDLAAAYAALNAHASLDATNETKVSTKEKCAIGDEPIPCLRKLTGQAIRGRWLAALLPAITYSRLDQFDFAFVGNTFVSSPLIEDSLDTITVTWDLGKALNSASHRREAVKAIALHRKLENQDLMRKDTLVVTVGEPIEVQVGDFVHHPFPAKYKKASKVPTVTWVAHWNDGETERPLKDLNLSISQDGILIGAPTEVGSRELGLKATDQFGNTWPECPKVEATACFAEVSLVVHRPPKPANGEGARAY